MKTRRRYKRESNPKAYNEYKEWRKENMEYKSLHPFLDDDTPTGIYVNGIKLDVRKLTKSDAIKEQTMKPNTEVETLEIKIHAASKKIRDMEQTLYTKETIGMELADDTAIPESKKQQMAVERDKLRTKIAKTVQKKADMLAEKEKLEETPAKRIEKAKAMKIKAKDTIKQLGEEIKAKKVLKKKIENQLIKLNMVLDREIAIEKKRVKKEAKAEAREKKIRAKAAELLAKEEAEAKAKAKAAKKAKKAKKSNNKFKKLDKKMDKKAEKAKAKKKFNAGKFADKIDERATKIREKNEKAETKKTIKPAKEVKEEIPPRPKKRKFAIKEWMTDKEAVRAHISDLKKSGEYRKELKVLECDIWLQREIDNGNRDRNTKEIADWDAKYGKENNQVMSFLEEVRTISNKGKKVMKKTQSLLWKTFGEKRKKKVIREIEDIVGEEQYSDIRKLVLATLINQ